LPDADQAADVDESVDDGEGVGAVEASRCADVAVGDRASIGESGDHVGEFVRAES
jgi:hypothetical protein